MGTLKRIAGPAYIASSATNIYSPPNAAVSTIIRHIHIANKDSAAYTYSLYVGATGGSSGGTELIGTESVPGNSHVDLYFSAGLRLESSDFLSGIASSASKLVITVMGEYVAA